MCNLRYPVGIQSFPDIIEEGYAYVDKTHYIKPLLQQGKFIFLSRPRRFGKSLMLSTLKAYFEGRRDLFKGLAAETMDLDWTPSPVLRFDLNAEDFSQENGLVSLLNRLLGEYEKEYGMTEVSDTLAGRFSQLIRRAFEVSGRKVVILVDEYDKPLQDIQEYEELFEKNLRLLKSFFGNLKSMDDYIRFSFITGVARFSKVSIFSDLNNLSDISMVNEYADICGWTETELIDNFHSGIKELAKEREEDFDTTLSEMRKFYDGYLFAPKGSRLYNPFSVLHALSDREIFAYWFVTGTPTFLARWVRDNDIQPWEINGLVSTKDDLTSVGFDNLNPVPLMFQTGYLTIKSYDRESQLYTLHLPNREVELGFYRLLLTVYDSRANQQGGPFDFARFKSDLAKGNIYDFMKRLQSMLKDLPGKDHNESTYRAVTFLLAGLCGTMPIAEHDGYKGRSDLEVATSRFIYLFEFKYNKSVKAAMDQIHERDYAGRFAMDRRKVFLIGANFVEKKDHRGLEYEIENV
ncbi:MAG: ATP-binding protein [Muribaculaceae bacterium]|nr:ATP-binding protein [Muribaculaceae bacterium]MDE6056852.1 ATP-binding protein [Muribaculaceae bacterium]